MPAERAPHPDPLPVKDGARERAPPQPRPACGERLDCEAIRVRGYRSADRLCPLREPLTRPSPREGRGEGASPPQPRPACGERSDCEAIRVRGYRSVDRLCPLREPLTPALSPQRTGGERERRRTSPPRDPIHLRHLIRAQLQPIAFTFCSTCSTRVAPAMTLETCGREASQENASSSMVWPRAWANVCSFSTMSSLRAVR